MRPRHLIIAAVLTFAAGFGATHAAATAQPAESCSNVSGHVAGFGIPVFDGAALAGFHVVVTSSSGDFSAAVVTADLFISSAKKGGMLQLDGHHMISDPTSGLGLVTEDFVRISPSGVVNDTLSIISGGSGTLHTHGTVDLTTGGIELRITGRVCG